MSLFITKTSLFKYYILKSLPPQSENFQINKSDIFRISAQNIDCEYSLEPPRRGGSNEYPQSMFLSSNKKNNVYLCKPNILLYKSGVLVGCWLGGDVGSKLYRYVFVMFRFSLLPRAAFVAFNISLPMHKVEIRNGPQSLKWYCK